MPDSTNKQNMTTESLLQPVRRNSTSVSGRFPLEEFYSDRSRIIYSKPFRRLQRKAQVFSLESNTAVRTRLTHSLEVTDVGRLIAAKVADKLKKYDNSFDCSDSLIAVVENACLLHDFGNPPFGHFGEAAIKRWFRNNWEKITDANGFCECQKKFFEGKYLDDFLEFDGNPQGFRLVTGLNWDRDKYGLNLTIPTLKALVKYVRFTNEKQKPNDPKTKKAGFFESERFVVDEIYDDGTIKRYPLAYIMEAADDIAYCTSDISDAIEKKIVTPIDYYDEICQTWRSDGNQGDFPFVKHNKLQDKRLDISTFMFNFIIIFARKLIEKAAENCIENWDDILAGDALNLLPLDSNENKSLEVMKKVARKLIYRDDEVEKIELSGYALVSNILEANMPILSCSMDDFMNLLKNRHGSELDVEYRLVNRLPNKYKEYYKFQIDKIAALPESDKQVQELFHRCHLLVDYIAGMTDDYALEMNNVYRGIDF